MGINEMRQKLQDLMQKFTERREDERQPLSNMPNGSVSGYQPKVKRYRAEPETADVHPASAFAGMAPAGVNPMGMPGFNQQAGQGQPAYAQQYAQGQPPRQPQQGQQPFAQQGQSFGQQPQQMQQPQVQQGQAGFGQSAQPFGAMNQTQAQPHPGYHPRHQSATQPQGGWTGYQQPVNPQQPQQTSPQQPPVQRQPRAQQPDNVRVFPGTVVDDAGNGYSMVLRVAQITSINSCYRLLEFMNGGEAVIVNADSISDTVEGGRCMDMLFGAAYAMNMQFERISGKLIYLITPRHVHVLPFDSMLRMSREDIERRWPGSSRAESQENRYTGPRQGDFAQRAAAPQAGAYQDFGGFGGYTGFGGR